MSEDSIEQLAKEVSELREEIARLKRIIKMALDPKTPIISEEVNDL